MTANKEIKINVFFAYSREDAKLRDHLEKHLSALKRKEYTQMWYDGKIDAGKEWEMEIDSHLAKADIILLLISANFIASDYCYEIEMKKAISRHNKGEAVVIPIILASCDWSDLPFSKIQSLPQNGIPITSPKWLDRESAFSEVATSIKNTVYELRLSKGRHFNSINTLLKDKENDLKIILELIEEKQLEIEIQDEEINRKRKELEKINNEYTDAKDTYTIKYSQLQDSLAEIENSFLTKKEKYDTMISDKQVTLNKLRNNEKNLTIQIEKLKSNIAKLEQKKINIEEDIKKCKHGSA
jgi:DNA repair exonuclease SbcCD ATPase subunit